MFLYEKTKLCKKAVQHDLINKMCFEQNAIELKSALLCTFSGLERKGQASQKS